MPFNGAQMFDQGIFDAFIQSVVFGTGALLWVIALVRLSGARTLSKMTAFDFVVTLATGSLLATAAGAERISTFVQALSAMTVLLGLQYFLARARRRFDWFRLTIENEPLLLMRDGKFIDNALRRSRVARSDVCAKIRQSDVRLEHVTAVILETTGDLSVLTDRSVGDRMLAGVRGA